MKNKILSKAYGGVTEARHRLNGLGLPRQWKVITSTLLLLFTFAIGNVLAQLTPALPATTLTLPNIPTEGWKGEVTPTYYKAAGSNVYVFCPYELYKSVADLTWTTQNNGGNASPTLDALAPFPASSVFTGYKAATLNGTSKGPYAYRVTNCVKAYVRCVSGSNKKRTITLAAYEIDGEGNVAASAAASDTYEANSDGVISIDLNMNKEYYIKVSQVGSGSGGSSSGNSTFYMLGLQAPYKVTLDPDGGSYPSNTLAGWTYDNVNDKYSKYVAAGSLTLPSAPSKGGYDFTEWQDNKANAYTTSITIDKDTVLTAQWIAAGSAYDVNIASMTNGSVVASPASQVEDGIVTLTVTPDDGYLLSSLSVVGDVSGDEVTVTANQFTMPAEDVTINATFSLAPTYTVTLNPAGGTIVDATGWTLNAGNYEKEVAEGTVLTLPTFTKTDRAFKTWRKAGPADVESPVTVTGDLTLTAIWTATIEQVIYSWEGAEGGAIETGGTAQSSTNGGSSFDDAQINVPQAGYYCIQLNGKNDYSTNLVEITLSGDEKVKTGDKIKYTGFYNNADTKNAAPKMRAADGTAIFSGSNLPNITTSEPRTDTHVVPSGINTATVQLTRAQTQSSSFLANLQIIRDVQVEEGDLLTVTFDTKGGSSISPVMVASGQAVAKPADPTKAHNRFKEWQLAGSAYNFSTPVTANITLVADWTQLYTISFAAGDGSGDAPAAIADKAKDETFEVPANTFTAPASKEFDKWNDGSADYAPGATYTVGTANVVLTAQWKAVTAKYTVIFKDGETTLDTKLFEVGSNPSDADIDKTKPLFAFAAWQKDAADIALDDEFWATVVKDASVTLTARWTKVYAQDADLEGLVESEGTSADWQAYMSGKGYAYSTSGVSLDAKAGGKDYNNWPYQGLKAKEIGAYVEGRIAADKLVIIKLGHMAAAANVSLDGVAAGTATGLDADEPAGQLNYFYVENESVLRYETTNGGACVLKAITITNPYEVTFNANGGDPVASQYGHPAVTLPDASNGTKSLLGWFDAAEGGNKIGDVGESYTPAADIELFAQWEDVSTDARLASITLDPSTGVLEPAFDPEVTNYTYTMPYGTAAVPQITGATAVNAGGSYSIVSQASAWDETAVIRGVAASSDTKAYNITMKIAPKDGVCIIKATINSTTKNTIGEVTGLYKKDASCGGLSGYKFNGKGAYIGIELVAGQTFNEGDVINVHTTTAAEQGTIALYNDHGNTVSAFHDYGVMGGAGDNKFALPASAEEKSLIYVCRTEANTWNGFVDYIEVTRAMNPVLTAITIDERAGVIDPLDDKHFNVTIPYEADLAALTVVPTIVRNAAHPTTPEAVISNEGAWILGDNTYRIMDKDGDYTDYTITLDRDVLKHTVSFNTHGGTAIDPVLVAHGEYLAAAPSNPEKEDYIFQHWSLSDGGAAVDVTTVQINEDKEFHAVWVADGAIKLLDGSTVNHTNFITAVTADETVEFQGNTVNYAKFSGTVSGVNGVKDLTRVIAYNATTNKTKIQISAHNNSTSARNILVKGLVEGADAAVDLATIALGNKEDKVSDWIEFDNAANRTIYIFVPSSAGDVYFTQVKVIESGENAMKQAGEAGYALNLNKGRFFGLASTDLAFEGLNARLSGDYTALNSGYAKLNATSMSFTVAAPMLLKVTTNNNKTYYVTEGAAGTDNETAKTGESEFALTAGTWYITAGASEVQFTNIAFAAPKCEQPTITPMSNSDLCEGNAFEALTVTASVSDGGTLHYAWFKEAGADDEAVGTDAASYTPEADGEYYVVVTNRLADHSDNSATSNTVTVKHFAAAVITTAPLNQRGEVGDVVTLSVVATGKNVSYKWYTCDEDGGNEEALDPAETGTSLNVTVTAGMSQWYKVIVTSDCGNAEAKAKVSEFEPTAPANVTGSITWDWTSSAWPASGTAAFTNEDAPDYELLADADAIVPNAEGFRSDMLYGKGQYVWRSGNKFFQGTAIKFTTEVAGRVRVYFRSTGSGKTVEVAINGTSAGSRTNSFGWSSYVEVPAGEVEMICTGDGYTRIQKIEFEKRVDQRGAGWAAAGELGTVCLESDAVVTGANLYELAGLDVNGYLAFDQILSGELEAGKPYLFEATSNALINFYAPVNAGTADQAEVTNGMHGTFTNKTFTASDESIYYFSGRHIWAVKDFTVSITIPAYYCYVDMSELQNSGASEAPAPGRRRISMSIMGSQIATGIENTGFESEAPRKVLINGELYILRGEKMYDAKGQLVK